MGEEKAKILDEGLSLQDGLENLIAQLGGEQDKRSHSKFVNRKRLSVDGQQQELSDMYRTDWLSGKMVDIIPDDMTREWRTFDGEITPEQVEQLEDEENRLQLRHHFNQAHKWARLYGTAFIVMNVDDGQDVGMPLDPTKVRKGQLKHIKSLDRHRVSHADTVPIQDPMNANYGMPEFYRFNETSIKIHHSRVIRFDGVQLPYDEFRRNNYYSDSVLDRMYESLTNFNTVANGAASMVYETNVDIMKVKGLMNYLSSAEGEAQLRKRFALASLMKSFNNTLLLDNEEDFQSKKNTFAGLPDLLDRYALFLSGGSDIPATRLLGSAASGLNATGEGDLKNYYDTVRSNQVGEYKPKLDLFDIIMANSLGLPENADLSYKFNSLFQMTPQEQATLEESRANRDEKYVNLGVITEAMVAKELQQESTYTNIDDDHIELLEEGANDDDDTDIDKEKVGVEPEDKEGKEEDT